jgi:hypothetical protein
MSLLKEQRQSKQANGLVDEVWPHSCVPPSLRVMLGHDDGWAGLSCSPCSCTWYFSGYSFVCAYIFVAGPALAVPADGKDSPRLLTPAPSFLRARTPAEGGDAVSPRLSPAGGADSPGGLPVQSSPEGGSQLTRMLSASTFLRSSVM